MKVIVLIVIGITISSCGIKTKISCNVDDINNYKRPNSFLRKFLFKYVINERHKTFKRESTKSIQNRLTASDSLIHKDKNYKIHLKINWILMFQRLNPFVLQLMHPVSLLVLL